MSDPRPVGIGLIGCGWMGEVHSAAYMRVRRHFPECRAAPRLVIAADDVPERAHAAIDRLGFARATRDPMAVIGDPDVDAVSIATPNHLHLPLAAAAAAAGKPFWIEKPVGRFPAETAQIAEAAADVVTTVGFNYRHVPAVAHARELVRAGELGEVRMFRGRFLVDYASRADRALSWRFTRDHAGLGVLGDLMSHVVDLALHLTGPVASVCADRGIDIERRPRGGGQFSVVEGGEQAMVENEDHAIALARLGGGGRASFEVSRTMVGEPCHLAFEVHGTDSAVAWDFQRMGELRRYRSGADRGWTTVYAGPEHGDFARFQPDAAVAMGYDDLKVIEARTFLESVLDGRARSPNVTDALAVAEVVAAMERSCETRTWEAVG